MVPGRDLAAQWTSMHRTTIHIFMRLLRCWYILTTGLSRMTGLTKLHSKLYKKVKSDAGFRFFSKSRLPKRVSNFPLVIDTWLSLTELEYRRKKFHAKIEDSVFQPIFFSHCTLL